jgi:DNA polymerase-3 subunit gamma/tau
MIEHMAYICQEEKFQIADESLALIAREATGSMRDALSLFDQVLSCFKDAVSHDQVLDILGVIDRKYVFDLCDTILRGDISAMLDALDDSYNRGHDLKKLYTNILEHFRNLLVVKMGQNVSKLVDLPEAEVDQMAAQTRDVSVAVLNQIFDYLYREDASIRRSDDSKLAIEMAFIRMDQVKPALPIEVLIDRLDHLRQDLNNAPGHNLSERQSEVKPEPRAPAHKPDKEPQNFSADSAFATTGRAPTTGESSKNLADTWKQLYEIIAQKNPSLAASLSKCRLKQLSAERIEIEVCGNDFTLNMLQRKKNMAALKKICTDYFGKEMAVSLTTNPEAADQNRKKKSQNDNLLKQKAIRHPLVADAIEIFNGKLIDIKIR